MSEYPTNLDDVIDSRDVIEAITDAYDQYVGACGAKSLEPHRVAQWAVHGCPDGPLGSSNPDMVALFYFAKQGAYYCEDWEYGATLVRDSYFVEYAQNLADDLGLTTQDHEWPYTCIDWQQAARELKDDYSAVKFDGVTYWVR